MAEPPVVAANTKPSPRVDAAAGDSSPVESERKPIGRKFLETRWAILLTLFCVTGFLGIPVLCMSPAFTKMEKVIWSILVSIYTSILIAITGGIIWYVYSMYADLYG